MSYYHFYFSSYISFFGCYLFFAASNVASSSSTGGSGGGIADGDGATNVGSGEPSNASSAAGAAATAAAAGQARAVEYGVADGTNDGGGGGGYGRGVQVLPASEIWFAHRKYRVVVCLDLSTSVFAQRWGEMPADSFVDAAMMYIEVGVFFVGWRWIWVLFALFKFGFLLRLRDDDGFAVC